jgi:hypothetical protein
MNDSFMRTRIKQLDNLKKIIDTTSGSVRDLWVTKWYELIQSTANEINNDNLAEEFKNL